MTLDLSFLVSGQLYAFADAVLLGIALGVCYDIYRSIRLQRRRRPAAAVSFVTDCLFWIAAAAVCITVIIARRWGELFYYTYLGLAAGFACYFFCLSRYLLPFWVRLFAFVFSCMERFYRLFAGIFHACAAPFRWSVQLSGRAFGKSGETINYCRSRILRLFRRTNK